MLQPGDIHACLKWIQQDATVPPSHPIGFLTTENRDVWANARGLLLADNKQQIEAIDSALFNLVLDDVKTDNDPLKMAKVFLHGNGANRYLHKHIKTSSNLGLKSVTTSRWFDKSFSLIVTRDGKAAVNFEHAWGDGVAVMRFINESLKDSTEKARVHPHETSTMTARSVDPSTYVQRLGMPLSSVVPSPWFSYSIMLLPS